MELTRRQALASAGGMAMGGLLPGMAMGQAPQRGGTLTVQLTSVPSPEAARHSRSAACVVTHRRASGGDQVPRLGE